MYIVCFSLVQSLSRVQLFATPWTAGCQASLSITNSRSLPKPMSIELVMPSNHLILCCPHLLLPSHIYTHIYTQLNLKQQGDGGGGTHLMYNFTFGPPYPQFHTLRFNQPQMCSTITPIYWKNVYKFKPRLFK